MKAFSGAIVLGIGLLMVSGTPARAQFGDMGEAVKKGAGDAVKQEIMKGAAEQAGLPTAGAAATTPGAAAATPAAGTGAASTPAAAPASDTGAANAPVGAPKVTPGAAEAPAGAPGAAGTGQDGGSD